MIEFKDYIDEIIKKINKPKTTDIGDIICFFQDNDWFGEELLYDNGKVYMCESQVDKFTNSLSCFLSNENSSEFLFDRLQEKFPHTTRYLKSFLELDINLSEDYGYYLADFLLYYLTKELALYTQTEIDQLVDKAANELLKQYGDALTFFMSWLRVQTKTNYYKDLVMNKRYTMTIQNEAYSFDEYLELMYYLYCDEYIEANDMWKKAAESVNFTDTWLFLAIHFICSVRLTDLERIYHPHLMYPPEEILMQIGEGTFSDMDAITILNSIIKQLCIMPLYPNKTRDKEGISQIKIHIPDNCQVLFGKLFALAEAHRQLSRNPEAPIIRKISGYEQISRYMGEEIGSLFLSSDFRARSATKSYLQSLYMLSEEIDGGDGIPHVKGYILASLARSHKGSYGKFAETTNIYLKDGMLNGLTPEFVAYELLQRGVLSFIPTMLFRMMFEDEYVSLNVRNQTKLHQALNLSLQEIDATISRYSSGIKRAELVLKESIEKDTDILSVLHRIGNGQAVSKEAQHLCLYTALKKECPNPELRCIACRYEISTKSTMYLLIDEAKRIKNLYTIATNDQEKDKYRALFQEIIIPRMDEMLACLRENYGEDVFEQYESMIKENLT